MSRRSPEIFSLTAIKQEVVETTSGKRVRISVSGPDIAQKLLHDVENLEDGGSIRLPNGLSLPPQIAANIARRVSNPDKLTKLHRQRESDNSRSATQRRPPLPILHQAIVGAVYHGGNVLGRSLSKADAVQVAEFIIRETAAHLIGAESHPIEEIMGAKENQHELQLYLDELLKLVSENKGNPNSMVDQLSNKPLTAMCMGVEIHVKDRDGKTNLTDVQLIADVVKVINTIREPGGLGTFVAWLSHEVEHDARRAADMILVLSRTLSFLDDNIAFSKFAKDNKLSLRGYENLVRGVDIVISQLEGRGNDRASAGSLRKIVDEVRLRFVEILNQQSNPDLLRAPIPFNPEALADVMYSWYQQERDREDWATLSPVQRDKRAGYLMFKYLESCQVNSGQIESFCNWLGNENDPGGSFGEIRLARAIKQFARESGHMDYDERDAVWELMNKIACFHPKEFTEMDWSKIIQTGDKVRFVFLSISGSPGHPGHGEYIARSLQSVTPGVKTLFIFTPIPDADNIPNYDKKITTHGFGLERGITHMALLAQVAEVFPDLMANFFYVTYLQPDPRVAKNIVRNMSTVSKLAQEQILRDFDRNGGTRPDIEFLEPVFCAGEDELNYKPDGGFAEKQPDKFHKFGSRILSRMGNEQWLLDGVGQLLKTCPNIELISLARGKSFNAVNIRERAMRGAPIGGMVSPGIAKFITDFWSPVASGHRQAIMRNIDPGERTAKVLAQGSLYNFLRILFNSDLELNVAPYNRALDESPRHKIRGEWPTEGRFDADQIKSLAIVGLMQIWKNLTQSVSPPPNSLQ